MTTKPLCLACGTREVYCVARVPLCVECDPCDPDSWSSETVHWTDALRKHVRAGCRPCRVFLVWLSLEEYPNTATNPRAERVRRIFDADALL